MNQMFPFGQGMVAALDDSKQITSSMIGFVKKNVVSVTELTRTKKLSQILDGFSNRKSEEIFLVQSTRNKDGLGAIIDVDLLEELLLLREVIAEAADRIVEATAAERVNKFNPNISLAQAMQEVGVTEIDVDEVLRLADEMEI